MSRPTSPTLFDDPSPHDDEFLLLDDLQALVALGLLERHPSADGAVFALTELGRHTPEFGT
jgi:hypothetical protein